MILRLVKLALQKVVCAISLLKTISLQIGWFHNESTYRITKIMKNNNICLRPKLYWKGDLF